MDALRTLAASLDAGDCVELHLRDDASGYGDNIDNPRRGDGTSIEQGSKCQWDPTPWRAYGSNLTGSWVGYRVNNGAGYAQGATTVALDSGTEPIVADMVLSFKGIAGKYVVSSGIPVGGAGSVTFTPGLAASVADNLEVRIQKRGERIWHFGHAHTAQSNSWPSWTCLELYDNKWKSPAAYRHFDIDAGGDPYLDDIVFGNFHQDGGTTFDPAKQIFYKGHPTGSPTVIQRIDCSEYNPLNIGKFTDFALTGTLTWTEDSNQIVGAGTSFTTQLEPGYQIWRNGYTLFNGISEYIVTVASIEDNDHLTLVSDYQGASASGTACSAHNAYDLITHWGWEAGASFTLGNANACPAIEHWPERDSVIFLRGVVSGQAIYEKRTNRGDSDGWTQLFDSTDFDPSDGGTYICGGLSLHSHYNTKRRSMLLVVGRRTSAFGADGDDGAAIYELTIDDQLDPLGSVTLTQLDSITFPLYVNNTTGGQAIHDPVTGKYLFLSATFVGGVADPDGPYIFAELDPDASPGSQITMLDGSVFPEDLSNSLATNQCTNLVSCIAYNLGVIFFMGKDKTHVYKHTANNWASEGMTSAEKEEGIPGLTGYYAFGNGWVPKYWWDTNQTAADPAFAAAVSSLTFTQAAESNIRTHCWSAHSGAPRTDNGDGVCIPILDTNITYQGEGASFRFVWRNQTGVGTSWLEANIDGSEGTAANANMVNPTDYARSTKLYIRYPMRVDATMLGAMQEHTPVPEFSGVSISTTAVDSQIVNYGGTGTITSAWIGKNVYIDWIVNQNWRFGFYEITDVNPGANQFTLNESPTLPGFQGFNGAAHIEPDAGSELAGTKVVIVFGNRPNGTSSSGTIETTALRLARASGNYDDYTELYGHAGGQGFPQEGFGGPMVADTWHVFDIEIEYRPDTFYTTSAGSLVIHSDTYDFAAALVTFSSSIYFNGYGPRDYAVDASPWVPGIYTIVSVDTGANTATLDSSPTPSAAGTDGQGFVSCGSGSGMIGTNRVRLWQDGVLCLEYEDMRSAFANYAQPYGHGSVNISNNANHRDTTQVHDDAYTYFGHVLFSTQPIPFEAGEDSGVPPPTPPTPKFFRHQVRQ